MLTDVRTARVLRRAGWAVALAAVAMMSLGDAAQAKVRKTKTGYDGSIVWGARIDLVPPEGGMGRYPRLVKVTQGDAAGDLLLFYQTVATGGDFWMYRSRDAGRSWQGPQKVNAAGNGWNYASCNVIQLDDGRLMMSMQRRKRGSNLGKDYFIDVKYSDDGGASWGQPTEVFQGANWEARPIQVPNDANGDGINDIYIYFTQHVIPTDVPEDVASREDDYGRAVAWFASYDGGKTWGDPNTQRFTAQIIHRNFQEAKGKDATDYSGGGMPTPFVLPGPRIAFVAEEIEKAHSPYVVASDPGDWDWTSTAFQGAWTSANYDGMRDDRVYPQGGSNIWRVNDTEFGGAPYAAALPDGRIAVAVNSKKRINVWLGDTSAHNFVKQEPPFGDDRALYAFVEPISASEVLVGAGPVEEPDAFIYLRIGKIAP